MAKLSIYLLGDFQVRLDDQVITRKFRTRKERALLAFLAVEADRSHARDSLGEFFCFTAPLPLPGLADSLPAGRDDGALANHGHV